MRSFTFTREIARSPADVFAFITDFRNAPRWRNLVRSIEVIGGGPVRQGSQLAVTLDVMGKEMEVVSDVIAFEPTRRIGQRNVAHGVAGTFEYVLEPTPRGTRVTFTCDVRPYGWRWLLLPLLIRSNRLRYRDQLSTLERAMEKRAG
jgi:hypothetical protein